MGSVYGVFTYSYALKKNISLTNPFKGVVYVFGIHRFASICQFARDHIDIIPPVKRSHIPPNWKFGTSTHKRFGKGYQGFLHNPPIVEPPSHGRFPQSFPYLKGGVSMGNGPTWGVPGISLEDMLPSLKLT